MKSLRSIPNNSLVFIICLFIAGNTNSQIIRGRITDVESKNPISFASIGLLHRNAGVVADFDGLFSLNLEAFSETDTLRISAIGFEAQEFLVSHCRTYFIQDGIINFELVPKVKVFDEVTVIPNSSKIIISGNNIKSSMIVAGFQNKNRGAELGTILKYNKKRKGQILTFNFNIAGHLNDTILFRINLYDLKNSLPNKNILDEPIYFKSTQSDGKLTFDASELDLFIKEDCFLSIELIDQLDFEGLFFNSAFLKSPSFHRETPLNDWVKANVDLGFWCEIRYK